MAGGGVDVLNEDALTPASVTFRVLDLVIGDHVLFVLSETSISYVTGLVEVFAGKLKVKLKV